MKLRSIWLVYLGKLHITQTIVRIILHASRDAIYYIRWLQIRQRSKLANFPLYVFCCWSALQKSLVIFLSIKSFTPMNLHYFCYNPSKTFSLHVHYSYRKIFFWFGRNLNCSSNLKLTTNCYITPPLPKKKYNSFIWSEKNTSEVEVCSSLIG